MRRKLARAISHYVATEANSTARETHMPRSTNLTLAEALDAADKTANISDANFSRLHSYQVLASQQGRPEGG